MANSNDDIDKEYTKMCSNQTIFSDKNGFFGELYASVRDTCSTDWIQNKFTCLLSDTEKLKLIFNEPHVCDVMLGILEHVSAVYKKKDANFSAKRRADGEKSEKKLDFQNALVLFTQAVLRAPAKGMVINDSNSWVWP